MRRKELGGRDEERVDRREEASGGINSSGSGIVAAAADSRASCFKRFRRRWGNSSATITIDGACTGASSAGFVDPSATSDSVWDSKELSAVLVGEV